MNGLTEKYLSAIDEVIEKGEYKDDWESLARYPVPRWYAQAKFGVFIHWGVYSVPAYFSEWYCRMMYYKGNPVYWHHRKVYGKDFDYRRFIPMFKAEKFDPDVWVKVIKEAGARFIMPVGEHHDGFKMYNSGLSQWNSVNMGPKRDVLGKIKNACEKNKVTFSVSSHRAEHFWFMNGGRTIGYDNETLNEEYRSFYGPCVGVYGRNNLFTLLKQEHGIEPSKEWLEDWLVSSCEIVDRYEPSSMFFDWWVSYKAFRPYFKKFLAYYYNRSLEWGRQVCVYYKSDAAMYNCAIFDRERGQLPGISPYIWQSETSAARNAWSYCTTNKFKPSRELACNMADVISKNGCFVLNIGPKADGTICPEEMRILREMGEWTKRNEEAIWGTSPYKVFGEGKIRKNGSFKENYRYTKRDYRFTYKSGVIYVFVLVPAGRKEFKIKSLARSMDMFNFIIKKVSLLGDDMDVNCFLTDRCLKITVPEKLTDTMPLCFKIEVD